MDHPILAVNLAACEYGIRQADITGIAPFGGAVPAFAHSNFIVLAVCFVFHRADRTWFFMCGGFRNDIFCHSMEHKDCA